MERLNAVSQSDVNELRNAILTQALHNESFERDTHLNELVHKPWGHEYRIFCNQMYDAWKLKIFSKQETSMHCHPRKDTVLLCLEGTGIISFLDKPEIVLIPGKYVHLPRGVYHSTTSLDNDLHLVELENPRNKLDLLRCKDRYGRENTSYECEADNNNLEQLKHITEGKNTLIRRKDYEDKFSYSLIKGDELEDQLESDHSKILFIALINDFQHLKDEVIQKRIHVFTTGEYINRHIVVPDHYLLMINRAY